MFGCANLLFISIWFYWDQIGYIQIKIYEPFLFFIVLMVSFLNMDGDVTWWQLCKRDVCLLFIYLC